MIDSIRDFIPVQAIGPAIGGATLWFGANFLYLGPQVIAPRIAERQFIPACLANVAAARQHIATQEQGWIESAEKEAARIADEMRSRIRQGTNHATSSFFSAFGDQGRAFAQHYGRQIERMVNANTGAHIEAAVGHKVGEFRQMFSRELENKRARFRSGVQHATAPAFCGCLVTEAFADRVQLASYTASFRLYEPAQIEQRRVGTIPPNTSCGTPPLLP